MPNGEVAVAGVVDIWYLGVRLHYGPIILPEYEHDVSSRPEPPISGSNYWILTARGCVL